MRVLVCGSRDWYDADAIRAELIGLNIGSDDIIIHGDCRGADRLAGMIGEELGAEVQVYRAQWHVFGKSAGPRRNQAMLDEGKPDLVLAFHWDLAQSKGTKHMVGIARAAGVEVKVVGVEPATVVV